MKEKLPLPDEKKVTVIVRIEPGCLGPQGDALVDGFCRFAQPAVETIDAGFVIWELQPRHDKSQPEMQYRINGKVMNHDMAARYLALFGKSLDEFEGHIHNKITLLIDDFIALNTN